MVALRCYLPFVEWSRWWLNGVKDRNIPPLSVRPFGRLLWYDRGMELGELYSTVAQMRQLELKLLDDISQIEWKESGYPQLGPVTISV
ncbi:hypothetical protein EV186_10433 [Labedaea rhizosphaerae]|uniref:Uncharacterized protein n=1 Tax=Labedaea rhizosphaerae TaxID=598644 RepID=A0A4R6S9D0_LABRH|nr:hypothetical protein EV186_10433 [Labedaea rhizosphaerae]